MPPDDLDRLGPWAPCTVAAVVVIDDPVPGEHAVASRGWREWWWQPVSLAAAAVLVRVTYWVLVTPNYVPDNDAGQYREIAVNLTDGRGFSTIFPQFHLHTTAFRPPLYPLLLAGTFKVFGTGIVVGRVLNLVIGVGVVVLVVLLARRLGGATAGWVAGGVAAIYPPLLANDTTLLTEPLSLALMLGMLLALSYRSWWVAAILCGLLVLSRPSAQYLVVVVALWALWQLGWRRSAGFLAITALVVSPWVVRNWVQLGSPVLVTSNGFNWAAMYSPPAQERNAWVDPVYDPYFEPVQITQETEVDWQRNLQDIGITNLRKHPGMLLTVASRNLRAYLEIDPSLNRNAELFDGRNWDFRQVTLPAFYLVTVAGLLGLLLRWRQPIVLLCLGIVLYFAATSLILIAAPRLRAPVDVLCCLGVGLVAGWIADRRSVGPSLVTADTAGPSTA